VEVFLAHILTTSGYTTDDPAAINRYLDSIEVLFSNWPIPAAMEASKLLTKPALDEMEKKDLLEGFEEIFLRLQKEMGMKSRDLIVLHPGTIGLSAMLDRFSPCHTHDDEEVRYVIDGEGEFGFVLPTGEQALLKIGPGDFIRIPKNTEHWFVLTEKQCIKAIRYFSDTTGWVPQYTSTKVRLS
jgi:1,2-dihydroxy-3-keto-5-methylthiopentene dioxygenase